MLMKFGSMTLIVLMINLTGVSLAFAGKKTAPDQPAKIGKKLNKKAAKIKAGIEKLGVGKESVVEVKLRSKKKITGYVSEINEESFTLIDANSASNVVAYSNAKQVRGNNLSKGAWIAIGFGLAMLTFLIVIFAIRESN